MTTREPAPAIPTWLEEQCPDTRYQVSVGNQKMHVMEAGEGRPVVLLHGNPTWGFLYRLVMEELAGEPIRLIAPDLIGLGFSSRPQDMSLHNLEQHAAWFGELIDRLELEDLIFVGQDWGGPIGFRAFADRPETVKGMVILNTVTGPPKPGFSPTLFHKLSRTPILSDVLFKGLGFPQTTLFMAQGKKRSIGFNELRAYNYPLKRFSDRAVPLALARMVPDSMQHASVASLEKVHTFVSTFAGPVGIVWGSNDPILGRLERRVIRTVGDWKKAWRTQAGHFLQEEVPEVIARAIQWVDEELAENSAR